MTQIKIEKAKEYAENAAFSPGGISYTLTYGDAYDGFIAGYEAADIAETEAEERHAKELQELKDRAIEAFCSRCQCKYNCPKKQCENLDLFTQKLNEQ